MLESLSPSNLGGVCAPTARLPPIKLIQSTPLAELQSCIEYLRFLYNPEVRGSRLKRANNSISKDLDLETVDGRLKAIRIDAFERSHAIRWLTALVARSDELITSESDGISCESLIEDAASLLAACAGTAGSGHVTRTYSLGPSPAGEEVVLKLTDAPLENGDYASVGAQTWGGACVMADMIFEDPDQFDLPLHRNYENKEGAFRILELGAGTGLVGLAVAKLLELRNVHAEVVLSDVHPSVLSNLRSNVHANLPPTSESCVDVSIISLDWSLYASAAMGDAVLGTFDLILGADIIYEATHAIWIKACLEKLLRPGACFHLVIPLRHTHVAESSTVQQVFGEEPSNSSLEIEHEERLTCDAHSDADFRMVGRADEVEYAYYKVGWKLMQNALS